MAKTVVTWTQEDGPQRSEFDTEKEAYEVMCYLWGRGIRNARIQGNPYYDKYGVK